MRPPQNKITPERKVKKTHSRAFKQKKSTLDIKLTQNSPPPPQLFIQTKQSDIMSFFNHENKEQRSKKDHEGCEIINCDSEDSKDKVDEDFYSQDCTLILKDLKNFYPKDTLEEEEGSDLPDLRQRQSSNLSQHIEDGDDCLPSQISSLRDSEYTLEVCLHGERKGTSRKKSKEMCQHSESRGIKRKSSEENIHVDTCSNIVKKKQIIDSQTAALELENFSCLQNSDLPNENSERVFQSHEKCLIDSEEAVWELQNFSVDTENLSQYIYK